MESFSDTFWWLLIKFPFDTSSPLCVPGVNTMANYEQVLHLIRYKNWHTEALFDRKFRLVCSELNGRYISNDFKVEVWLSICQSRNSDALTTEVQVVPSCYWSILVSPQYLKKKK